MEEQIQRLVDKTIAKCQQLPSSQRLLIAISGIPGSGKTTLAKTVAARLNILSKGTNPSTPDTASYVPMDGYHFSRAYLSSMPNPEEAHARRGAAFTFDAQSFLTLVQHVRLPLTPSTPTYYAPSFDHALKDPVADDIPIPAESKIIIFEGNYLSLDKELWREAAGLMDELWFVEVEFETAGKRLVPRHVKAGIAADEESAWKRVRENDLLNGEEIVRGRMKVDEVIVSREDETWAG